MCNLPWTEGADSLRERIGYEYGVEEPELPPYWDNYGGGIPESVPIFTDSDYNNPQPPFRVPVLRPGGSQPQPLDRFTGKTYFTSSRSTLLLKTHCPVCVICYPASTQMIQVNKLQQKPVNQLSIEIKCAKAGKHLKLARKH